MLLTNSVNPLQHVVSFDANFQSYDNLLLCLLYFDSCFSDDKLTRTWFSYLGWIELVNDKLLTFRPFQFLTGLKFFFTFIFVYQEL